MKTIKLLLVSLIITGVLFSVLSPGVVSAGIWDGIGCNTEGSSNFGSPCSFCEGMKLGVNIVVFLRNMAIMITAGLIVYGGAMMMISAGNQSKFSAGKGIMTAAVWGLVITLLAWIIISTILVFLVKKPEDFFAKDENGKYSWNVINCTSY